MALTAALTALSVGLSAVGSIASARQQEAAARFNRRADIQRAEFNQSVAEREARIKRAQARADADDRRRQVERDLSALRAAFGSNNLAFAGSALDVFEDSATQGELAVNRILFRGELRAQESEIDANLSATEAENARRRDIPDFTSAAILRSAGSAAKAGASLRLN